MTKDDIARVAHEANRAYCTTIGDDSQVPWAEAPDWQKESAVKGVQYVIDHGFDPVGQHQCWLDEKTATGWKYGPVKDVEAKTHPCFVSYNELPSEQQVKDDLFGGVTMALLNYL